MSGMRFTPKGYGGHRRNPDEVKRDGWREQGVLAVSVDDQRLTWPERELVVQHRLQFTPAFEREPGHAPGVEDDARQHVGTQDVVRVEFVAPFKVGDARAQVRELP